MSTAVVQPVHLAPMEALNLRPGINYEGIFSYSKPTKIITDLNIPNTVMLDTCIINPFILFKHSHKSRVFYEWPPRKVSTL